MYYLSEISTHITYQVLYIKTSVIAIYNKYYLRATPHGGSVQVDGPYIRNTIHVNS
jgi:hypothetical protein